MSKRKRIVSLVLVGVICWLGALGLFAYNRLEDKRAALTAENGYSAVASEISLKRNAKDVQALSMGIPELKTIVKNGYTYVGIIEIPSEGIALPVLEGCDLDLLKVSPCHYSGSPFTDDMVIGAHNYNSHFNCLRWVEMGEKVIFTTVDGIEFNYVIVNRETLNPTEVERMTNSDSDWDLTLFTCYPGGATRCTIRCERAD